MTSIITGDIVNSRGVSNQKKWLTPLKKLLSQYGKTPRNWEIFRGDSFQLEVKKPEESFMAAIRIKACIRAVKGLDVRMAIGIGDKEYNASRISESNGPAFIYSGEKFESLKRLKQNLAIGSPWPETDTELNMMISLALIAMNKWSQSSAELVNFSLEHQELSQTELGYQLGRTQSSISARLKRAYYTEIIELERFYRKKIAQQIETP